MSWSAPVTFASVWERAVAARGDASFLVFEAPDGAVTEWTMARCPELADHTGDRAVRDRAGRWCFDGRRSDVLKVAGENVSTVEVESVVTAHPGVLEAAVVGAPDPIRDEVPIAFVVAVDPAAPPTPDELTAWCAERLGKPKVPREFTFVDELPRTSVGKIRKFLLQEEATS